MPSGRRDKPSDQTSIDFRRSVLLVLLFATALFGAVFAVMNVMVGNHIFAVFEVVMGALAIAIVPAIKRSRRLWPWSIGYLIPFSTVMMLIAANPASAMSVFTWVTLIPVLSVVLLGRTLGSAFTVVFLTIALSIFADRVTAGNTAADFRGPMNLAAAALCILGFSLAYETSRERGEKALRIQARTDPLTGLGNRLYLTEIFPKMVKVAAKTETSAYLILMDIDHFKKINDTHGHDAGDFALKAMANLLTEASRDDSEVFRYGGEEFCLLCRAEDQIDVRRIAERLREIVAGHVLTFDDQSMKFTVSIGVSDPIEHTECLAPAMSSCDARLYQAKNDGRNRVVWNDKVQLSVV